MRTRLSSAFAVLAAITVVTAAPGASAQSVWGHALSFNGVNDRVLVPNFGQAVPTDEITVEFWQRLSSISDQTTFYLLPESMGNRFTFIDCSDGSVIWDCRDPSGLGLRSPPGVLAPGAWQHFAVVCTSAPSSHTAIYCNGVLKADSILPRAVATTEYSLYLGKLSGELDDFRIWNKARTQAEIAAGMLHPLTGTESNLVAYWRFDETEGDIVLDSTTNHYDGLLTNGPARVPSSVSAPNLVVNPSFEDGTTGWNGFGWATLTTTSAAAHSGTKSGFVFNRTNTWPGVAQQFNGVLQPGITYHLSAWVRLENSASGPAGLNFVKTDGSGTVYTNVARGAATSNQWTQLKGTFRLSVTGSLTDLTLYMDGPGGGTNFYADDFVIVPEILEVPQVTTLPAEHLSASTSVRAELNGTVIPNGLATTAWFEYGTNGLYDQVTARTAIGSGWEAVSVSRTILGLTARVIYHYRAVASNSLGVARGAEQRFWLPDLRLNGPNPLTNECHMPFVDPGARETASPVAIAAGGYHSLALKADGTVVGWGSTNNDLANGALAGSNVVAMAVGGSAFAGGSGHNLALKAEGKIVGWGVNWEGQATGVAHGAPGLVAIDGQPLTNVMAIAAGHYHSLALRIDHTVVGWGDNWGGQATGIPNTNWPHASAGLATIDNQPLTNVAAIAAGGDHSLALKTDGTIVGWGYNFYGQATGTTNEPSGRVALDDELLTSVAAIAAGGDHSLALKADGTVVGWGRNDYGQATGNTNGPPGLVSIDGLPLSNVVAIAAGDYYSLALRTDGTVVGWGVNRYGQVTGVPNTNYPNVSSGLVMVEGETLTNVVAIDAGSAHGLALQTDGTIVGWGYNETGAAAAPAGLNLPVGVSGAVNADVPGSYVLTYRTTNALGAVAVATRTVRVVDTRRPELTLLGANPLVHPYKAAFADPGATATDLCGGDLSASILVTGNVDVNRLGTCALTYTATDAGGNSVSTNRTVRVMTAPSFTHGDSDGDGVVDQAEFDAVAQNYWGLTSQPYMTNIVTDGHGLFQMTLTNAAAWNFSVEVSTNLVNWDFLGPAWPFLQFNDPAAPSQPQRYYRLRWP